jgi:signal peptidase I
MTGAVRRGDIVSFPFPKDPAVDFIKRIVGLGGEQLEIRAKKVYIDGRELDEPYVQWTDPDIRAGSARDHFGPVQIPENELFVMGDNRDRSNDSRFWGFLPRDNVKGRAFSIYWSWDPADFSVRWKRIGTRVD